MATTAELHERMKELDDVTLVWALLTLTARFNDDGWTLAAQSEFAAQEEAVAWVELLGGTRPTNSPQRCRPALSGLAENVQRPDPS